MKALIFGANSQDGFYLAQHCQHLGLEPVCTSRSGNFVPADVTNYEQVAALVRSHAPRFIFNFAAISSTSHEYLFANHHTIGTGTLNILEAVRQHSPTSKVFITGSGTQFLNRQQPIRETDPFAAQDPYSVARIQAVYAARYYRTLGIAAYVGYLFHHESPRRGPKHISQVIAAAARRIARGSRERLPIGDPAVRKEWAFAGDIVQGVLTLVRQDQVLEAVIGTGVAYSIGEWAQLCFSRVGLDWQDHVIPIPGFTPDYRYLVSNPQTINALGWQPVTRVEDLAAMMTCPAHAL